MRLSTKELCSFLNAQYSWRRSKVSSLRRVLESELQYLQRVSNSLWNVACSLMLFCNFGAASGRFKRVNDSCAKGEHLRRSHILPRYWRWVDASLSARPDGGEAGWGILHSAISKRLRLHHGRIGKIVKKMVYNTIGYVDNKPTFMDQHSASHSI